MDLSKFLQFTIHPVPNTIFISFKSLQDIITSPYPNDEIDALLSPAHCIYNDKGRFISAQTLHYLFQSKEINEYLMQNIKFMEKAVNSSSSQHIPEQAANTFLF